MIGKRFTAWVLSLVMGLSLLPQSAAAATFTDLEGHWAKSYIENMAKKGVVKGYEDKTYRPNTTLSVSEGLAFCARTLQVEAATSAAVLKKHREFLEELLGESNWFLTEFALCLESGILTKAELTALKNEGKLEISRKMVKEELMVYVVRSLGLEQLAEGQGAYPLSFADADRISDEARPSVYLLNMYGIVSGDQNNNFTPDLVVNRGVMATILSRVLDFRESRGIVTELPDFTAYDFLFGQVTAIAEGDTGAIAVTLNNGLEEASRVITLSSRTPVYEHNMKTTVKTLKAGNYVRVNLSGDGTASAVRVLGDLVTVGGTVTEMDKETLVLDLGRVPRTVTLDRFTTIKAGGSIFTVEKLDVNADYRTAQVLVDEQGKAVTVIFGGGTEKVTGFIRSMTSAAGGGGNVLKVVGYDGMPRQYALPTDVMVLAGTTPLTPADLDGYSGKLATLRLENETGTVQQVVVDTVSNYMQGSIRGFTWQSSEPTVTITDLSTGRATSHAVNNSINVTYRGEAVAFQNLKSEWYVTARLENKKIVEMFCFPAEVTMEGILTAVDFSATPVVALTVTEEDGDVHTLTIDVNSPPDIRVNGERRSVDKLQNGAAVKLTLQYGQVTYVAATPRSADLTGVIQAINQTLAGDSITVKFGDNSEATYIISGSTAVFQEGKAVSVSQLKAGDTVSLVVDGDRLTSVKIEKEVATSGKIRGKVVYVNNSEKTFLLEEEGSGVRVTVSTGGTVFLEPMSGLQFSLLGLSLGDSVTVYGRYSGTAFKAISVLRGDL